MTSYSLSLTVMKVMISSRPKRESISVDAGTSRWRTAAIVECWMYDYNWSTEGFPIIASGRWG